MAARCILCRSRDGIRSQCPKVGNHVVCRTCCIREQALGGDNCHWWTLCSATDLRQWEW